MSVGKDHVMRRNRTVRLGAPTCSSKAPGLGVIARCMRPSVGHFNGRHDNGNAMKMAAVKHNRHGCILKPSTHAPAFNYKVRWNFFPAELPAVKMLRDDQV